MSTDWQSFLRGLGAVVEGGAVAHFGDPAGERAAAAGGDVVVELSHLALVRARGTDTMTFLQGQLSNDIRQLDASHSQLSSYSTPKGRMLAVFRIFRRDEDCLLQLPAALRDDIAKRLRMFVLRSKVTLDNADDLAAFGISGPRAAELVREVVGVLPGAPNGCATQNGISVLNLPGLFARFEIVAGLDEAQRLWRALAARARPCASPVWRWLDIWAGLPTVLPATSEAFVPQMANLDVLGGVNFKKGCYTGQEIVARVQYLGQLKQRMYRAHVETGAAPLAGDTIHAEDFGEQAAGTVVDAQPSPAGGYDLLAVVQVASARHGNLRLRALSGEPVALQPLPYPVPED